MYTINLTREEYDTCWWCAHKDYLPFSIMSESGETHHVDGTITLHVYEYLAFDLVNHDPQSLYTCMAGELVDKWIELENSIV